MVDAAGSIGLINLHTYAISWRNAEHPKPLTVDLGSARLIDAPGLPVGGINHPSNQTLMTETADDAIVAMVLADTEGLIERSGESFDESPTAS